MQEGKGYQGPDTQAAMLSLIKELRSDPERYKELQTKVAGVKTDAERAQVLSEFVASESRLSRVLGPDQSRAAATTVTVTTVIIIVPSAY